MTINLKENERIDDLQRNGYRIIQNSEVFCFGMDAVLLCGFARVGKEERVLDLGCGNGIIPILLKARTEGAHFTGLEIQDINVDMANRSVALNGIEDSVDIVKGDIKEVSKIFAGASFDVVTSNPPYMNENHGLKNPDSHKAIARHEILCTLDDVVAAAARVLKPGGRFYMVHRPHRLSDIYDAMRKYRIEPKRIRFVHPFANREANMVLIEGIRGGRPNLRVEAPLIIYREEGRYTPEVMALYEE